MLKCCVDQWEKNKENLRVAFENCDIYSDYEDFARLVIENIFSDWEDYNITTAKAGDSYQGDLVFLISAEKDNYNRVFLSDLSYGSCSICDTLMSAAESEERVEDFMRVALNFIQNMKGYFD